MASLRRKIKLLDAEITSNKEIWRQQKDMIKQKVNRPTFFSLAFLISFSVGFFLEYQLVGKKARRLMMMTWKFTRAFYKDIKNVLTFIAV